MTEADSRRAIIDDLTGRLRPVCAQWPEEQFKQMVERLADITLKYDHGSGVTYDRRSTDRLVADLKEVLERSQSTRDSDEHRSDEGLTDLTHNR
jgi:hypothetical protein